MAPPTASCDLENFSAHRAHDAPDGTSHGIMCPMGGKILEVNSEVQSQPSLLEKDPYFKGWLYRILPSNPENNLKWLSL